MDARPSVGKCGDILQDSDPWKGKKLPAHVADHGGAASTNAWDSFLPRVGPPGLPLRASAAEWFPEQSASREEYESPSLDGNGSHLSLMNAMALIEVQNNTIAMLTGKLEATAGSLHEIVTRTFLEDAIRSLATVTAQHLSKHDERIAALEGKSFKSEKAQKHIQDQIEKLQPYVKRLRIDVQDLRNGVTENQRQVPVHGHVPEHINIHPVARFGLAGATSFHNMGRLFTSS